MLDFKQDPIISALRKNARTSLAKIARDINLPKSTVFDTFRHHEKNLIHKHSSLINFQKLGFTSKVFLAIKTTLDGRDTVRKHLMEHKNTNNLYVIDGGFDFFLESVFRDAKEMEDFLAELKANYAILTVCDYRVFTDLKRESFLEKPI